MYEATRSGSTEAMKPQANAQVEGKTQKLHELDVMLQVSDSFALIVIHISHAAGNLFNAGDSSIIS